MTTEMRARRMRRLIASFAAILGLAAILRGTEARLDSVSTRNKIGRKPSGWVVLDGVEYRPTQEISPADRDPRRTYRTGVEACDPVGGGRLWKVTIRECSWPEPGRGMLTMRGGDMIEPPWLSDSQFLARLVVKLAVRGKVISATSADGGAYLVDPETRQVRQVQAPTPPKRPIRDARSAGKARCEVHDRSLLEDVVPIHYGFGNSIGNPEESEVRRTRFPNATTSIAGGCVIGPSREARVLYCPDCRESERDRATIPAVRPSDDEVPPVGLD